MSDISIKLDGNVEQQEAEARGQHSCTWACLKNNPVLPECEANESQIRERILKEQIERWRVDIKRLDYNDKDQRYDFLQAYEGLVQNNALSQKPKTHRGYQLGAREFTLTYSPKWFADDKARINMIVAMNRLLKYYDCKIEKLRAVGEVGTNGLSHIHCFYKLNDGTKITDKNFQRAWPHWNPKKPLGKGFEGGHHANVKEESDFLGYIDKEIKSAWVEINVPSGGEEKTCSISIPNEGPVEGEEEEQSE